MGGLVVKKLVEDSSHEKVQGLRSSLSQCSLISNKMWDWPHIGSGEDWDLQGPKSLLMKS